MPDFRKKIRKLRGKDEENEKATLRDDENTKALFLRCEELDVTMLKDEEKLDRGDFVIARVILNFDEEDKGHKTFHDHWVIVDQRYAELVLDHTTVPFLIVQ